MKIPDFWLILSIHWTNKDKNNKEQFNTNVSGVFIIENGVFHATDIQNSSILRTSICSSYIDSASTVFSTAPRRPLGICQSKEEDCWSHLEILSLNFISQTHTADVCTSDTNRWSHPYEYQDKGWTRLVTHSWRVIQNGNNDSCVVNITRATSSELLILTSFWSWCTVWRTIKGGF